MGRGLAKTMEVTRGRPAELRRTQKFHRLHNLASPSPVTDGEVVVAHFGNGDLAAYDFTGKKLWFHDLQKEHGGYTIWWGHANSPVLYGDLVISVCMQDPLNEVPGPPQKVTWLPTTSVLGSCAGKPSGPRRRMPSRAILTPRRSFISPTTGCS